MPNGAQENQLLPGRIEAVPQGDIPRVAKLCLQTFLQFEAMDYDPQGIESFRAAVNVDILRRQMDTDQLEMWGFYEGDQLYGVIALRRKRYITLLFVDKKWHKKGIGRRLVEHAVAASRGHTDALVVRSSLFAIPFYEHLGFATMDSIQLDDGTTYLPMRLEIK